MSEFTLVDPKGWEWDLHSVYSAYVGHFQTHNIAWYEKSWGHLFSSFEEFLAFSWPVIVVTDAWTGKAHIVTKLNSIGAFLKMVKTRFGETLPQASNMVQVTPFETSQRHLRHVSDYPTYRKLHNTLPAAVLSAKKQKIRNGDPQAIKELWEGRDKTFLAIDFEWSERNQKSCLEWGYAAVRCGHLNDLGYWPPSPDENYRKGHFVVQEYVDKVVNKWCPNYPWHYAFGDSQVIPKAKLSQIIQAVISSLASPDSEILSNNLVLVAHGVNGDLTRLEEMKIALPHNMFIIDTAVYETKLFNAGLRPPMVHPKSKEPRQPGSMLSLENLLRSISVPVPTPDPGTSAVQPQPPAQQAQQTGIGLLPHVKMHNAGNDAFMCLFVLQYLVEPEGSTKVPTVRRTVNSRPAMGMGGMGMVHNMSLPMNMSSMGMGMGMGMGGMGGMGMGVPMNMNMTMPPSFNVVPPLPAFSGLAIATTGTGSGTATGSGIGTATTLGPGGLHTPTTPLGGNQRLSVYNLSGEFGQMRLEGSGGGGPGGGGGGGTGGTGGAGVGGGGGSPGKARSKSPGTRRLVPGSLGNVNGNGRSGRRLSAVEVDDGR